LVFQRSPGWIAAKDDYIYPAWAKWMFRNVPFARRLHRFYFLSFVDFLWYLMVPDSADHPSSRNLHLANMVKSNNPTFKLALPELISKETLGCKRLLISDEWYPMFTKPNVKLITQPVSQITSSGLETADGAQFDAEVIVFACVFFLFLRACHVHSRRKRLTLCLDLLLL